MMIWGISAVRTSLHARNSHCSARVAVMQGLCQDDFPFCRPFGVCAGANLHVPALTAVCLRNTGIET